MTAERRFPAPWTVEEYRGITRIVRDASNFPVAYINFDRSGVDVLQRIHDQGSGEKDRGRDRQAAGAAEEPQAPGAVQ
jgi:hypothetical protein